MLNVLLGSIISSILLISYGTIFSQFFFNEKLKNINPYKVGIYGFIFTSFISLFLNFFFPINEFIGSVYLIFSIVFFLFYFLNYKKKFEIILTIILISITTFVLILYSDINRPDAGLYHLPYTSILQNEKIIIGITNLHYRFAHTSIFQYISAIYNNYFLSKEFLVLPSASLFSIFIIYLLNCLKTAFIKKDKVQVTSIFLITIFSFYSFSNYSNYGNDMPANVYFYILVILMLQTKSLYNIKNKNFFDLTIISLFLYFIKPSMIITIILPFCLFLFKKNKILILKNKNFIIIFLFISIWTIKNILISGCGIFPIKQTCIKNLFYYDENSVEIGSQEAEAWAKGYPDSNTKLGFKEYNKNFNWIKTWFNNHFNVILEKIIPLIILLIIFYFNKFFNKKIYIKNFLKKNLNLNLTLLFTFYCCVIWFLKFPVYRFGLAFISSFLIIFFVIFYTKKNYTINSSKYYTYSIIIVFLIFITKNIVRIIDKPNKNYVNNPWPKIYSMQDNEKNIKKEFVKIYDKNENFLYYYTNGSECMFSNAPCSNYLDKKIKKKKIKEYNVFYK